MNYLSSLFGYAQEPPKVQTLPMYRSALEFETKLLSLSKGRHPSSTLEVYDVELGDTKDNFIHTVEVSNVKAKSTGKDPIVIMHGYGNGIGYLFRNLLPLSASLPNRKIFGIDMLGFGLSSRPDFYESVSQPESVSGAESFFVESLEQWREAQKIDRMVLAGHSMGGYLSVAYTEKYPERVSKLILLSPVGVPKPDLEKRARQMANASMRFKALIGTVRTFWRMGLTPMSVLRKMPEGRGKALVDGYVFRRMQLLEDEEKTLLSGYFYNIGCLPGSGEFCLQSILDVGVLAKEPLVDRIPKLKLPAPIGMLYGAHDWMDVDGGLEVQKKMEEAGTNKVDVRVVKRAGHLLNLENPAECNRILADLVNEKSGYDKSRVNWRESEQAETNRI